MDSWYLVHYKQEREINKEIDVIICLGLCSNDRVLSKASYCFWRTALCSVWFWWFWSLVSFCLPWAFQPLEVKWPPSPTHFRWGWPTSALPELLLSTVFTDRESGDVVVCSWAALISPPVSNYPRKFASIFPSYQKVILKRTSVAKL